MNKILITITGFLMALADTMPGLSGGTICFIMGIYDKFIASIKDLINKSKRKKALKFLSILAIGWIIGFIFGVIFIDKLLEKYPYEMISFFLGLVIAAIPITFKDEYENMKNIKNIIYTLIGIIIVVGISTFNNLSLNIDINNIPIWFYIYCFFVAIIAIGGMLLPGISGSTILLIFGIYTFIISTIKDFITTLDLSYFPILFVFGMGILVGGFSVTKLISYLFKKHRGIILYLILGLMIGSIYSIYNAPKFIINPQTNTSYHDMNLINFNFIMFLVGICAIIFINGIKNFLNKK